MHTIINGSPKVINSNSSYFINIITKKLDKYNIFELKNKDYNNIINSINKSDIIILVFPLYVDSPTSITISFLDYIIDNQISLKNKNIYTIINCGFREGEQNITAINIIKRWCEKVNAIYCSSILIGAGEIVGKKKYKLISLKANKMINKFAKIIEKKQKHTDIITTMDLLNNKMYCYLANKSWRKRGKKNNLSNKELRIQ
jgi:hypothetical protein